MAGRSKKLSRSRKLLLTLLVLSSGGLMLLPSGWGGKLANLAQVIVPLQGMMSATDERLFPAHESPEGVVRAEDYDALARERDALQHQVASLATQVESLRQEMQRLTGIRNLDILGSSIGQRGRLIPARVVSSDLLPWRASRLIDAGNTRGVHRGSAVTSHHFAIQRGTDAGVQEGLAILLSEVLVGYVEQASSHTARVKLISDPTSEMRVTIGRFIESAQGESFAVIPQSFWLAGAGGGRMRIPDVDRKFVEDAAIGVGDIVLSDPMDAALPAAMVVGAVEKIDRDTGNPLLYVLTIRAPLDERELRNVYVYDPDLPSPGQ